MILSAASHFHLRKQWILQHMYHYTLKCNGLHMEIFFKEAENNVHAAKTVEQSKFTVS